MRDICEDLRQRIQLVAIQRGEMQARLAWLDKVEAGLKATLEFERMQLQQPTLFIEDDSPSEKERSLLSLFLREILSDLRPRTLEDLKAAAQSRGIDFEGKSPGRVLHFALVGMAESGIVENVEKGVWRMTQQPPPKGVLEARPLT